MSKITPHLWFAHGAEEAARFYVTLVPESRIDRVTRAPADGPGGSITIVEFTLAGEGYSAFDAAGGDPFNHAVSLMIHCEDQAEVDRVWDAILATGGAEQKCGWIRDGWGLHWQIIPRRFGQIMAEGSDGSRRAAQAMMGMTKLDVAALDAAYRGD